ncbi:MAG: DM13 domain-containing protein [Parcubacteria group bacterium]|nr:DM13 domain-containing protein [Parcubacteria group bacterium]
MKKILIVFGALVIVGVGYYTLSPLFRDIKVEEAAPESMAREDGVAVGQVAEARFAVVGTTGHPASGFVRVIPTMEGTVVRYEDFETINGPDLHVYLATTLDAKEFVDLGPIKGTQGNINYTIPSGADISKYRYVMYWCVPFRVLFNYAEIHPR